jgi:hypothetical protein
MRPIGFITPAQPVSAPAPPSGPGWLHEIKHDGHRLMAWRDGGRSRAAIRGACVTIIATVAFLVPFLTTLSLADDEPPPPFAGFAPGPEGEKQREKYRETLDEAAKEPGAPPRETIERMKREPPRPGETMEDYGKRMGIAPR